MEFETGHALWALAAAGVPRDHPQVSKALSYLMGRQQVFGGWFDPLQSFENFRTPFRETQFAVIALSSYYPGPDQTKGWNSPAPAILSKDPIQLLSDLDRVWSGASPVLMQQIEDATRSNDILIRQASAEALGRLGQASSTPALLALLGDPSKLVQRTAAWSLRQIYSRSENAPDAGLLAAFASPEARVRWGAARVFAHHFSTLAKRDDLVAALGKLTSDPVIPVRMEAVKGLWQSWFWNADPALRGRIEDTVIAELGQPQHPWVTENLKSALYNLADENIRYLYNNWVPLLAREPDRERAIRGRLGVEAQLAEKIARVLGTGADAQKKRSGRARRSAATARRYLRCERRPVQAWTRDLQPHWQRYRADRVFRRECREPFSCAAAVARLLRPGDAASGRGGLDDRARNQLFRRRQDRRRSRARYGVAGEKAREHAGGHGSGCGDDAS